jgi:hypothetical protein
MRTLVLSFALAQVGLAQTAAQDADEAKVRAGLASITAAETAAKVKKLAGDEFEGRNAGYPGCWEAAEWIAARFAELGLQPAGDEGSWFQLFTFAARGADGADGGGHGRGRKGPELRPPHHPTPTTRNVVALLAGTDPTRAVVLGGHYDHVGREGQWNAPSRRGSAKSNDDIWNGADDNASGSAVVMEIAEAFAVSGLRPRHSILFVLFSAEEHGLYGSKHYCGHPAVPLAETIAMLNFDMVGCRKQKSIDIVGVNHAAGDALRTAIGDALLQVRGLDARLVPWARGGNSDHAPFLEGKVPAVFFFNGLHNDYHTIDDEFALISGKRMADVAKVGFLSALALAQLDGKPAFVAAPGGDNGAEVLGVEVEAVGDAQAEELGLGPGQGGLVVRSVYAGTPAADAGLEGGDVITALDKDVLARGREVAMLGLLVKGVRAGDPFRITVLREGKKKVLRGRMPE